MIAGSGAGGATGGPLRCQDLVERVADHLDEALPPEERNRVSAHLRGCPECREYLSQVRQTIEALGRLPAEELTAAEREELLGLYRRRR